MKLLSIGCWNQNLTLRFRILSIEEIADLVLDVGLEMKWTMVS